jgi:cytochrome P450
VARELPLQAICIVLGVPQEDRGRLGDWVVQGVETAGTATLAAEFSRKIAGYGAELSRRKRLEPADDNFSVIVHAKRNRGRPQSADRESLRIRYQPRPESSYRIGHGVHFCLGANLARLEMRVMFDELLARYAGFEFAGPEGWVENNWLFGLKRLPLRAS